MDFAWSCFDFLEEELVVGPSCCGVEHQAGYKNASKSFEARKRSTKLVYIRLQSRLVKVGNPREDDEEDEERVVLPSPEEAVFATVDKDRPVRLDG